MGKKKTRNKKADSAANLGFEAKLWLAADKLRNNMDAAEYKHTVLGLIFLKHISDAFEQQHAKLSAGEGEKANLGCKTPITWPAVVNSLRKQSCVAQQLWAQCSYETA